MDFRKDVDKPGHLVHGSYLENLDSILKAKGVFALNKLLLVSGPVVGFRRKPELCSSRLVSTIELYTQPWGYRYSLSEQEFWGAPAFHFFVISNYQYRKFSKSVGELRTLGIKPRQYSLPFHYESSEIALANQGIHHNSFVALVLPTDEIIEEISAIKRYEDVFKNGEAFMTQRFIQQEVEDTYQRQEMTLPPLFGLNGQRLD